jgi:hypothetical protein
MRLQACRECRNRIAGVLKHERGVVVLHVSFNSIPSSALASATASVDLRQINGSRRRSSPFSSISAKPCDAAGVPQKRDRALDGGRLDRDKPHLRLELGISCLDVSSLDIDPQPRDSLPDGGRSGRGVDQIGSQCGLEEVGMCRALPRMPAPWGEPDTPGWRE